MPEYEISVGSLDLGSLSKKFGKHGLIALLIVGFAVGLGAPFWFTQGYVSNKRIARNVGPALTGGFGLGSKNVFAFKGQTIEVEGEVHELNAGSLNATIWQSMMAAAGKSAADKGKPKRSRAYKSIKSTGKFRLSMQADCTGFYEVDFSGWLESTDRSSSWKSATSAKVDVTYSASWRVAG